MAIYTTTVRRIVESLGKGGTTIYEKIDLALPQLFDFDFPIFDEEHRLELERKIVMHYFNREIGLETVALWKLYLNERLNLEMPYYNQLYAVEANKFDYLINQDLHTSSTGNATENGTVGVVGKTTDITDTTKSGTENTTDNRTIDTNSTQNIDTTGSDTQNSSGSETNIGSDYPQATFNKGTNYASDSYERENSGNVTGTSTGHTTDVTTQKVTDNDIIGKNTGETGKVTRDVSDTNDTTTSNTKNDTRNDYIIGSNVSKTALMLEYRTAIINIDKMIVEMLADLFMGVY